MCKTLSNSKDGSINKKCENITKLLSVAIEKVEQFLMIDVEVVIMLSHVLCITVLSYKDKMC